MSDTDRFRGAKCFLDTNIWLYAFIQAQDPNKTRVASSLIRKCTGFISTQIINELSVNLIRKAHLAEDEIADLIVSLYERFTVLQFSKEILLVGSDLRKTYSISFWDSLVAASAIFADVDYLITEDMQDGLRIAKGPTIVNPFK